MHSLAPTTINIEPIAWYLGITMNDNSKNKSDIDIDIFLAILSLLINSK